MGLVLETGLVGRFREPAVTEAPDAPSGDGDRTVGVEGGRVAPGRSHPSVAVMGVGSGGAGIYASVVEGRRRLATTAPARRGETGAAAVANLARV